MEDYDDKKYREQIQMIIATLLSTYHDRNQVPLDLIFLRDIATEVMIDKIRNDVKNNLKVLTTRTLQDLIVEITELTEVKKNSTKSNDDIKVVLKKQTSKLH